MLLGQAFYKVGQKHRLAVPKKFRQELGQSLVITRGYEDCLLILGQDSWQDLAATIAQASLFNANGRLSARYLLGNAETVALDAQGRFVVPPHLYQYAELSDEVIFVGLGNWLEIWDAGKWHLQQDQLTAQAGDLAQRLVDSFTTGPKIV